MNICSYCTGSTRLANVRTTLNDQSGQSQEHLATRDPHLKTTIWPRLYPDVCTYGAELWTDSK